MKSSVISHPEREPLIIIRAWQMEFCEGNACAAALLSFFEYWHNIRLDMSDKAREANEIARLHGEPALEDESLWQFHTEDALEDGIMIYKRRTIREAIELLVEKGVLDVGKNPNPRYKFDKTKFFMFRPEAVQAFLLSRSGKNTSRGGKNTSRSGKSAARSGENTSAIKETSTETTLETSPETTTPQHAGGAHEDLSPPKKNRTKSQNTVYGYLVMKLTTKGGDKDRPPLIDELLEEIPERALWLDLPLQRVKELHAKATRIHKDTAAPFKNTFIKLLTDATGSDKTVKPRKTQAELDDEAEAEYQAQKREDEERERRRREQNPSPPGARAGGGGASGDQPRSEGRGGR